MPSALGDLVARTAGALHAGPDLALPSRCARSRPAAPSARAPDAGRSIRPRHASRPLASAASTSPSLRTTLPGLRAVCLQLRPVGVGVVAAVRPSSQSIFSASRPCIAAQVLLAMTATPPSGANFAGGGVPSIRTIFSTPGTFIAARRVERGDLAADHRRPRDHGVLHARQRGVLAVLRLAGRDVEQVGDRHVALADVAERARP